MFLKFILARITIYKPCVNNPDKKILTLYLFSLVTCNKYKI